jgi:hypothetical protein
MEKACSVLGVQALQYALLLARERQRVALPLLSVIA